MDFEQHYARFRSRIEAGLDACLPAASARPQVLHEAMRYATVGGGKRLRPVLLLATAELQAPLADPLPAAVAVELIHAYSLVHDDLPAMDDSPLRRGQPTVHKRYGEALAVLTGDALLTEAFALLARAYAEHPGSARALIAELAQAAGSTRLIGGQVEDTLAERDAAVEADLDFIHGAKTAALIAAPIRMGLHLCGAGPEALEAGGVFGDRLGRAFQIVDDLLDATATSERLGKPAGADAAGAKVTYVSQHGLEQSRAKVRQLSDEALAALSQLPGDPSFLRALVSELATRDA